MWRKRGRRRRRRRRREKLKNEEGASECVGKSAEHLSLRYVLKDLGGPQQHRQAKMQEMDVQ